MKKFISVCLVAIMLVLALASSAYALIYGDIQVDSTVDAKDAVKLAQHLAGWNVDFSGDVAKNADVHYDGEINAKDAVKLAQFLAGWSVTLGPSGDHTVGDVEVDGDSLFGPPDPSETEPEPSYPIEPAQSNLAIACDQYQKCVIIYDMDKVGADGDLDKAEIWRYNTGRTASVKYREDTVYGDVVITSSYSNGPTIISYPSKTVIWSGGASAAGDNPHSVEILPSGNMLSAASSGSTVRIYNNVNVKKNGAALKYEEYTLSGAHGLWYDPEYDYVWALGSRELVAYDIIDNGDGTESLKQVDGIGGILPSVANGHDLTANLADSRYLWITSLRHVVRYDKQTNTFELTYPESAALSLGGLKGFSNNEYNNFVYCYPVVGGEVGLPWENEFIASWSTNIIYYAKAKGNGEFDIKVCTSAVSAFYKVRMFTGEY